MKGRPPVQLWKILRFFGAGGVVLALGAGGCKRPPLSHDAGPAPAAEATAEDAGTPRDAAAASTSEMPLRAPEKIEVKAVAMGTSVTFVAFTTDRLDAGGTRSLIARAIDEIRRLEALLSEWQRESDIGRLNRSGGEWTAVAPETLEVLEKSLWAGKLSEGTFDVTFEAMSKLWKFGDAGEAEPKVPKPGDVERMRKLVDYRRIEIDSGRVRIGKDQRVGLGGIAKGYIVDRAAAVLRGGGLESFLVQAGGDLYGAGKKPDGSRWVSGIQDPRGPSGTFFGSIELEDHAFSTAGDYARSYVVEGKRYHHIIDPRTGYPATACRSVTIWAPDALTADVVDDIVFILGPEKGLPIVESLPSVGAVIVDAKNQVRVSKRLEGKWKQTAPPTGGI